MIESEPKLEPSEWSHRTTAQTNSGPLVASAEGRFVRKRLRGMAKAGQYRGRGKIEITSGGVAIQGRHVFSLGQRWTFAVLVFLGIAVLTGGAASLGAIPLYLIANYVWLKRHDQLIAFSSVEAFRAVPNERLLALQFTGTHWESPAVLRTSEWRRVYDALRHYVPNAHVE